MTLKTGRFAGLLMMLAIMCSSVHAQKFGFNTLNPDNTLDVTGDAQVSDYLVVGDPSPPTVVPGARTDLWKVSLNQMDGGLTSENPCGSSFWQFIFTDEVAKNYMLFDNVGVTSRAFLYTPFIWVPSGSGNVEFIMSHKTDLEDIFDGVFAEYWDGSQWIKLTNSDITFGQEYPSFTDGTTETCSGFQPEMMWTGNDGFALPFNITIFSLSGLAGSWTRFRLVAEEDSDFGDGTGFQLFHMSVDAVTLPEFGGQYESGNIYAEKNVYAGSNVLLGDLAEYFPIVGSAEEGDLISMVDSDKDLFIKTMSHKDENVIGIYSSNPTLTLNDPRSGVPVALQGRVPVNVVGNPIKKGDYLTASATPGKAEKADGPCFTVGRALEDFAGGSGQLICLVETGWTNAGTSTDITNNVGGSAIISSQTNSLIVNDAHVNSNSKVHLTMNGDPGHRYWVSSISNGEFEVQLSGVNAYDLDFSYLIEGASFTNSTNANGIVSHIGMGELVSAAHSSAYVKKDGKVFVNGKELTKKEIEERFTSGPDPLPSGHFAADIPQESGATPPAEVEDPTQGYTWSEKMGLQTVSSVKE